MSLGSKHDEMDNFNTLLNAFIKTHKESTTETKNRKKTVMKEFVQIYDYYFDLYKKSYNSKKVKDEEKRGLDYKQFEIIDNGAQEPNSTKKRRDQDKKMMEYKNHYGLN